MKNLTLAVAVAGLLLAPVGGVLAQQSPNPNPGVTSEGTPGGIDNKPTFENLDKNKDGRLSWAEIAGLPGTTVTEGSFADLDSDGDGGLTLEEATAAGLFDDELIDPPAAAVRDAQ